MKYETTVLLIAIVALLVPGVAYANSLEPEIPLEEQPCKFTAYIDKSFRKFTERIQVFGFVHPNCSTHDVWNSYKVHIKVVDMEGNVVQDNWKSKARDNIDKNERPSLYEFDAVIQETGVRLAQDENTARHYKVYPNQYYTSIPQLNSVHFEKMVVYAVEVSYGSKTVTKNFVIIE